MPYWDRFNRAPKRRRDDWLRHLWWLENFGPQAERQRKDDSRLMPIHDALVEMRKNVQSLKAKLTGAVAKIKGKI